jgi:uncharacterized membrane protein YvbJ
MFCGNCGKEIEKDVKFCTKCGNAVSVTVIEEHVKKKAIGANITNWLSQVSVTDNLERVTKTYWPIFLIILCGIAVGRFI